MITKYGCKVPKKYPHKDPLGLDLFIQGGKQFATSHRLSGVQNLYEEHGNTYQTRAFDKTVINTIDPDNLRAIYAVNFEDFAAQPTRLPSADPAIGLNVFTADGPFWKHARGQVTPIFTRAHLSDLTAFQKHVDKLFTSIPSDGSPFDIMPSIKTLVGLSPWQPQRIQF
jgi:cytochrome P450